MVIHNTLYKILFPILAFFLPLALYVRTLAPTYIPIDSAEFALCMHFWGVCHPPGFPLYIILGKIFTELFPLGSVIYKANLLSAIFGALTILIVYLSFSKLNVNRILALLISAILAVSATFWEFSIAADVFTFATFLIALTFYMVILERFYLATFVLGLSASHFYISAVLLPLLIWYFRPFLTNNLTIKQFSNLAKILFVFLLGFFPQALMFWRIQQDPLINWGHAGGFSGFIDFVRRKEFGNIFLLSNPVLQFSLLNFFKHIWVFTLNILTSFGVILPILVLPAIVFGKLYQNRLFTLFFASFMILFLVQLFLLSTIDPVDVDSPFQIHKFYLSAFIPLVLMIGLSLQKFTDKLFDSDITYPAIFLGLILIIYLLANYKGADFSKNNLSESEVLDALEELPEGSVVITVSHIFNFGSKYEQLINGKFKGIEILYFPNEKNKDNEKYLPEIFSGAVDRDFVEKITSQREIGKAEKYILETISRNLQRPIYILQGSFEERFFQYLKPFIRPYGLWWRVEPDISVQDDLARVREPLLKLRNASIVYQDIESKQQRDDFLTYAVVFHSTGIMFASYGEYDEALEFLNRSSEIKAGNENIKREIDLILETRNIDQRFDDLVVATDQENLEKLGNNLFILTNWRRCAQVFKALVELDASRASNFNNLASCQASFGNAHEARSNYEKALSLDPSLEKARKGLEALGR